MITAWAGISEVTIQNLVEASPSVRRTTYDRFNDHPVPIEFLQQYSHFCTTGQGNSAAGIANVIGRSTSALPNTDRLKDNAPILAAHHCSIQYDITLSDFYFGHAGDFIIRQEWRIYV